jgi:hypothetical protein
MKQSIFFIAFLCSITFCSAQTIGLRVGANLSSLKLDETSLTTLGITKESLVGLALAIPIEFKVHKNVSIQTELGFLQKGFKSVQSIRAGNATVKAELSNYSDYANIPVMVKLHTAGRMVQFYANIGPDAAYKVSSKQSGQVTTTLDGGASSVADTEGTISLDNQKRLAIGIQGGAGVKVNLGKWGIVLDGRFLTDLQNQTNGFNIQGLQDKAANYQGWMTSLALVTAL